MRSVSVADRPVRLRRTRRMRGRFPRTLAVPVTAAVLLLSAAPALAPTTTPIPGPANPGQGRGSPLPAARRCWALAEPKPLGQAVGDAGSALGVLRLLPNAVPTGAILDGVGNKIP